jgi:hypothetical protein
MMRRDPFLGRRSSCDETVGQNVSDDADPAKHMATISAGYMNIIILYLELFLRGNLGHQNPAKLDSRPLTPS